MTLRERDRPTGETPGPVRLTVVAYVVLALEVAWLVGYGAFVIATGTEPRAWAAWIAGGMLVVAFGLTVWEVLTDWLAQSPPE